MLTVREAHDRWKTWLESRKAAGTVKTYTSILKPFIEAYGDEPISSLTADDVEFGFLEKQTRGKAAATKRNHWIALKSLFDLAERHEWIVKNPLKRIDAPKPSGERKTPLSSAQDEEIQDSCFTGQERAIVTLLRHTGLRIGEAAGLLWEEVDLVGGHFLPQYPALIVRVSKTENGRRTIPLPPVLVKTLTIWRRTQTGPYVIGVKKGTKPIWPQHAARIVNRVGERAGVKISPHSLRRMYGQAHLNGGVPLHVVSRTLGHSSTTVTERFYARLTDDNIAAQIMREVS